MSRDSNRFKLDPTIVALNSQSAGQNYGHVISQAFKDLGDIENNKINLQLADTKNQYEEITDIALDYTESYSHQMLRYSDEYGILI